MSDPSSRHKVAVELEPVFEQQDELDARQVHDFLLRHPDFFVQNPTLLEKLSIPHQQKGSVSLVELQSEQLRRKVRLLTRKLNQLITIAKRNEQIYRIYADLNMRLLKCVDLADVQHTLEEVMQEQLKMSAVAFRPFKGALALPELQRRLILEKRFKESTFFFGRLSQHEQQVLFAEHDKQAVVGSVALVLLGEFGELGILAVASKDPSHFNPDMDTLLIKQLQQFMNVLLPGLIGF
ncbi:DUF484 family protein [Aestuariibacter salexigens]|uniref:DUF484 family protein n=1 Tax=Aestuariibacter salexigens TaxID=226010 RepID=UPI00040A8EFF|nr:DUF484 family protein [Aestuariibacter salexigens]